MGNEWVKRGNRVRRGMFALGAATKDDGNIK